MSNQKNIKYEDFDSAVKVSYRLGVLDGREDIRNQLMELRRELANMLKTNKELYRPMAKEHKKECKAIKLSSCFTRGILRTLIAARVNYNCVHSLMKKYETATGSKCRIKKNKLEIIANV